MSVHSCSVNSYTPDEMMTIAAARLIRPGCVCFVGIGVPSAAANLARLTHAADMVLIYESGAIGTHPRVLPLSIGDGELAETATAVVPLPEIFSYWLQAGHWQLPTGWTSSQRRPRASCASFATCISERRLLMPVIHAGRRKLRVRPQQAMSTHEEGFR